MGNEASVNELQRGKAKQEWWHPGITGEPQSLLFSTWDNRHFSKNKRLFRKETQTPNGTQKMLVSLPSLEEPKSFKGLSQEKGVGDFAWVGHFTCIISLNPNSIGILHIGRWGLTLVKQLSAVVPTFEPTPQVCLNPNSAAPDYLTYRRRACSQEKGKGAKNEQGAAGD